jgi:hypothetical protein
MSTSSKFRTQFNERLAALLGVESVGAADIRFRTSGGRSREE